MSADEDLLTLSVDTTTNPRSVALLRGPRLLAARARALGEDGTSSVLSDIDETLREASVKLREVGLFAVASGPGSFTGLRSGLATMKALAVTLKKPVVGVPTLHAIAFAARPAARVVALIPAGRGEVFAQLLGVTAAGVVTEHEPPAHVTPERLVERMTGTTGGLKWVGGGALKFSGVIEEGAARAGRALARTFDAGGPADARDWVLAPPVEALAESVAHLAQAVRAGGGASTAEHLRALYVRPSDAELNEQCQAPR